MAAGCGLPVPGERERGAAGCVAAGGGGPDGGCGAPSSPRALVCRFGYGGAPGKGPVGVVFDIDGTLAVASSVHLEALADAAHVVLGTSDRFETRGETPVLAGRVVAGWVDAGCFSLLCAQVGVEFDDVAGDLLAVYRGRYRELLDGGACAGRLIAGVRETLVALTAAGVQLGLATGNAAGIAETKLDALGIVEHFTFAEHLGFGDRHLDRAAVGAAAIAALSSSAGDAAVAPGDVVGEAHADVRGRMYLVGDTLVDMASAVRNGAWGVGVCTGSASGVELAAAGAHVVLADTTDLPGFLGLGAGRWMLRPVPGMVSAVDRWFETR